MSGVLPEDRRQDLLSKLDQTIALLQRCSKDSWADRLKCDRDRIANGDLHGIDHLLSAFGGMGSFNDLVITPMNGDVIAAEDVARANEELDECREEIWTSAQAIQRRSET